MKALKQQVDTWDPVLIHLVTTKLDSTTHKEWELTTEPSELPTFKHLTEFLQKRCQILENVVQNRLTNSSTSSKPQMTHSTHTKPKFNPQNKYHHNYSKAHLSVQDSKPNNWKCSICDGEHSPYQCTELINASHEERLKKLAAAKLCVNCLRPGHRVGQCFWRGCKQCGKKHNTVLHYSSSDPRLKSLQKHTTVKKPEDISTATTSASLTNDGTEIILSTALVDMVGPTGIKVTCRAFLDNGSQSNFITEAITQKLKLNKQSTSISVRGITELTTKVHNMVHATIQSSHSNFQTNAQFLVLPKITGLLPTTRINTSSWNIPPNIKLADPTFSDPAQIDVLLGQEHFLELLEDGRIKNENMPVLQNTALGWIVGGRTSEKSLLSNSMYCNLTIMEKLDNHIQRFWKLEEPAYRAPLMTTDNTRCEALYENTVCRGDDGRYTVTMPTKSDDLSNLGESYKTAIRRFHQVERRLIQNPELRQEYRDFMTTYEELGHMEPISASEDSSSTKFYLPHHPVVKEASSTTKLRVVFDASASTSTGSSLNDNLLVGPTLQEDLFSILIRFRCHKFVLTADIEKMYRQIWVDPKQRDLLRILWREHESQHLRIYKLKTVTYGTACAPYLAVKTLQTLAQREKSAYPKAARVTMRDFYVDDLLTGADSLEAAKSLRDQLIQMLNTGGFNLRQWNSNSNHLLDDLSSKMTENKLQPFPSDSNHSKALGITWDSCQDQINFTHTVPNRIN